MGFSLCLSFMFCCFNIFSQENNEQTSSTNFNTKELAKGLSNEQLLKKARLLKNENKALSIALAQQVAASSIQNGDDLTNAQSHDFLGMLEEESKHIDRAISHFSQASAAYEKLNDIPNQISSAYSSIKLLLETKRYSEIEQLSGELLPIALHHKEALPIGLIYIAKGDNYYNQKRFSDSISQYKLAEGHLLADDNVVKKHLAITYKKIAQAYKRLNDREQPVYFYKKALDTFTALDDNRHIARTLNTLAKTERYLGNFDTALTYCLQGLELHLHNHIDDPEGYAKSLVGAGVIYKGMGRYEKSSKQFQEAHTYYKKTNDSDNIANTSNQLGLIYTKLKQFDEARFYYQLSIDLKGQIEQSTYGTAIREISVIDYNSGKYELAMVNAKEAHKIFKSKNDKLRSSRTARVIADIFKAQKMMENATPYYCLLYTSPSPRD